VFADDRFVDRIAQSPWGLLERASSSGGAHRRDGGRLASTDLATADPLAELFETWRDELAADPMPALPLLRPTLVPQAHDRPAKRRSLRPALSIAAAIAALLVGSATIGSKNAAPDSALWNITQVMWPDRVESVASAKTVEDKLQVAKTALEAGRSRDAREALIAASVELGKVDPVDGQEDMTQRVRALWVASDQAAVSSQSTSSSSSSATSSSGLPTTPDSAVLSTVAQVPLVIGSTDAQASQLAGGSVDAPPATQQAQQAAPPAATAAAVAVAPSVTVPVTESPAPSTSSPSSASEVPPPPPVSSVAPPSVETTSLPSPDPVQSTTEVVPPASAGQSAPEQSPPAPTPLTQTPEPDPSTVAADSQPSTDSPADIAQ
jgi:hypothetical protein